MGFGSIRVEDICLLIVWENFRYLMDVNKLVGI